MQQLVHTKRAARFEMSVPMRYRPAGADRWQEGRTVNISYSGVLFRSVERVLQTSTRIEFILLLAGDGPGGTAGVWCQGEVVRNKGEPGDSECAMAATIESYDFLGAGTAAAPGKLVS